MSHGHFSSYIYFFNFISCVYVTEATENAVKTIDGEIMDLIYCFCFVLFDNFSAILGRFPGFNQY